MFTKKSITLAGLLAVLAVSCTMENPLLQESTLPYGAPPFDKIKNEHYLPAFKQGIAEAKAEVDAIVANPEEPTFENTVEALEYGARTYNRVAGIFYNILEANTSEELQNIAEEVSPLATEFSMYVSLNEKLFERVKCVYDKRESLGLDTDQLRLLDELYRSFVRGGANLSAEDKTEFSELSEKLSMLSLKFGKNSLAASNAFEMNLTDESDLEGLPEFVREIGLSAAREKGQEGWTFDLSRPSYAPFMQYSARRDLREKMWKAYSSKAVGGEFDNTGVCKEIASLRIRYANLLGYKTYADFMSEPRMVKSVDNINAFLGELMGPSLPAARKDVATVLAFAKENGFAEDTLQPWDFSYWSEKYKSARYDLSDEQLKPYFQLDKCIDAVFGLATTMYGIQFNERKDIPVYHKDVRVYDVADADGRHLALFYVDFFPRESKRAGAWMTQFRGQSIKDGVEERPFISLVTNFTKPTENAPSLITHEEFITFLHEFGHSLHGILTEGRYPSLTTTNVDHDFVELPSQIMENWGYEKDYLKTFAVHYQSGEAIPGELIEKIIASQNYLAAYYQVRQLQFGYLDMAWHTLTSAPEQYAVEFEKAVYDRSQVLPSVPGCCTSATFSHIFSGGYAAGYYSYKWAEVLAADGFSLFKEKGIFNTEVSHSFRDNILSKGDSEDPAVLYRTFRGHDPQPEALLEKLGIVNSK